MSVVLDYGRPVAHDRIDVSPTGVLKFSAGGVAALPAAAYLETTYERPKRPKIVHRTPLDPAAPNVNPNLALERFDLLLAIDTNTDDRARVSVGCVVCCVFFDFGQKVLVQWEPRQLIELRDVTEPPENIVWKLALESLAASPRFREVRSAGIVVDSDLDRIPLYNSRAEPIFEDFFLPAKMELLYASADTGSEFVANRLIATADKVARLMLLQVVAGQVPRDGLRAADGQPFSRYRQWLPSQGPRRDTDLGSP